MKKTVLLLTLTCLIAGCSDDDDIPAPPPKTADAPQSNVSVAPIPAASHTPAPQTGNAEDLALAAELMVSPSSFMLADAVATQALSIDPNNQRAQLIKHLVAPAMATKGILERIKPLATRDEKSKADYDQLVAEVQQSPNGSLKAFLQAPGVPLKTEADIQKFTGDIINEFDKLRVFFKDHKDMQITLHIPSEYQNRTVKLKKNELLNSACYWTPQVDGKFKNSCDMGTALEYRLNRGDIEGLQQIIAGYEIYLTLMNSYDLTGSIAVADRHYGETPKDRNAIRTELLQQPEFGTLRDGKGLERIIDMGIDAVAGIRWAKDLQTELCKPGPIFKKGICVHDYVENTPIDEVLKNVSVALNGGVVDAIFHRGHPNETTAAIKPSEALRGSIGDVRKLGLKFDDRGVAIAADDGTLGGVFVNGDATRILASGSGTVTEVAFSSCNGHKCVQVRAAKGQRGVLVNGLAMGEAKVRYLNAKGKSDEFTAKNVFYDQDMNRLYMDGLSSKKKEAIYEIRTGELKRF